MSEQSRRWTEYDVAAHNLSRESENKIHDDDVARRYGFAGGLVPGVTVYGYACHPLVEALGEAWVAEGSARVRFIAPCYEGETVTARVGVDEAAPAGSPAEVEVRVGDRLCLTGTAVVGAGGAGSGSAPGPAPEPFEPVPWQALAPERVDASEEVFRPGTVLGSIPFETDPVGAGTYLASIGERARLFEDQGWVHPGMLLQTANRVLIANVIMPAWIHVESAVRHLRPVTVGGPIEIRARVADEFERKGHRFVALDVAWLAGAGPDASDTDAVALARHVAIWRLAG